MWHYVLCGTNYYVALIITWYYLLCGTIYYVALCIGTNYHVALRGPQSANQPFAFDQDIQLAGIRLVHNGEVCTYIIYILIMYVYICICIYIYAYICTCVCVYVYIYTTRTVSLLASGVYTMARYVHI